VARSTSSREPGDRNFVRRSGSQKWRRFLLHQSRWLLARWQGPARRDGTCYWGTAPYCEHNSLRRGI